MATFVMQCLGCEVAAMNTVHFSKSGVLAACVEWLESAFLSSVAEALTSDVVGTAGV